MKNKLIYLTFCILLMLSCSKEDNQTLASSTSLCLVEINGEFQEAELDEKPVFLNGGHEGLSQAVLEVIRYPAEARENGIEGLCILNYVITVNGEVEDIEAVEDPGGGIGASAIESFQSATQGIVFSPGILNGLSVRVKKGFRLVYKIPG